MGGWTNILVLKDALDRGDEIAFLRALNSLVSYSRLSLPEDSRLQMANVIGDLASSVRKESARHAAMLQAAADKLGNLQRAA